jgi:Uma2 family endonuclease
VEADLEETADLPRACHLEPRIIKVMTISTSPLVKTYTLREFWELPEPSDRSKLELINGVLYMTPPPDYRHDEIVANLDAQLQRAIDASGARGKLYQPRAAIWLDKNTYLEPDLMYISDQLMAGMSREHRTRADIVIEVTSPSTAVYDRGAKADTYRAMRVRELWLVDSVAQQIEVRSFEIGRTAVYGSAEMLRSEVLPDIQIDVARVFA